jgi:hypothetical protein
LASVFKEQFDTLGWGKLLTFDFQQAAAKVASSG